MLKVTKQIILLKMYLILFGDVNHNKKTRNQEENDLLSNLSEECKNIYYHLTLLLNDKIGNLNVFIKHNLSYYLLIFNNKENEKEVTKESLSSSNEEDIKEYDEIRKIEEKICYTHPFLLLNLFFHCSKYIYYFSLLKDKYNKEEEDDKLDQTKKNKRKKKNIASEKEDILVISILLIGFCIKGLNRNNLAEWEKSLPNVMKNHYKVGFKEIKNLFSTSLLNFTVPILSDLISLSRKCVKKIRWKEFEGLTNYNQEKKKKSLKFMECYFSPECDNIFTSSDSSLYNSLLYTLLFLTDCILNEEKMKMENSLNVISNNFKRNFDNEVALGRKKTIIDLIIEERWFGLLLGLYLKIRKSCSNEYGMKDSSQINRNDKNMLILFSSLFDSYHLILKYTLKECVRGELVGKNAHLLYLPFWSDVCKSCKSISFAKLPSLEFPDTIKKNIKENNMISIENEIKNDNDLVIIKKKNFKYFPLKANQTCFTNFIPLQFKTSLPLAFKNISESLLHYNETHPAYALLGENKVTISVGCREENGIVRRINEEKKKNNDKNGKDIKLEDISCVEETLSVAFQSYGQEYLIFHKLYKNDNTNLEMKERKEGIDSMIELLLDRKFSEYRSKNTFNFFSKNDTFKCLTPTIAPPDLKTLNNCSYDKCKEVMENAKIYLNHSLFLLPEQFLSYCYSLFLVFLSIINNNLIKDDVEESFLNNIIIIIEGMKKYLESSVAYFVTDYSFNNTYKFINNGKESTYKMNRIYKSIESAEDNNDVKNYMENCKRVVLIRCFYLSKLVADVLYNKNEIIQVNENLKMFRNKIAEQLFKFYLFLGENFNIHIFSDDCFFKANNILKEILMKGNLNNVAHEYRLLHNYFAKHNYNFEGKDFVNELKRNLIEKASDEIADSYIKNNKCTTNNSNESKEEVKEKIKEYYKDESKHSLSYSWEAPDNEIPLIKASWKIEINSITKNDEKDSETEDEDNLGECCAFAYKNHLFCRTVSMNKLDPLNKNKLNDHFSVFCVFCQCWFPFVHPDYNTEICENGIKEHEGLGLFRRHDESSEEIDQDKIVLMDVSIKVFNLKCRNSMFNSKLLFNENKEEENYSAGELSEEYQDQILLKQVCASFKRRGHSTKKRSPLFDYDDSCERERNVKVYNDVDIPSTIGVTTIILGISSLPVVDKKEAENRKNDSLLSYYYQDCLVPMDYPVLFVKDSMPFLNFSSSFNFTFLSSPSLLCKFVTKQSFSSNKMGRNEKMNDNNNNKNNKNLKGLTSSINDRKLKDTDITHFFVLFDMLIISRRKDKAIWIAPGAEIKEDRKSKDGVMGFTPNVVYYVDPKYVDVTLPYSRNGKPLILMVEEHKQDEEFKDPKSVIKLIVCLRNIITEQKGRQFIYGILSSPSYFRLVKVEYKPSDSFLPKYRYTYFVTPPIRLDNGGLFFWSQLLLQDIPFFGLETIYKDTKASGKIFGFVPINHDSNEVGNSSFVANYSISERYENGNNDIVVKRKRESHKKSMTRENEILYGLVSYNVNKFYEKSEDNEFEMETRMWDDIEEREIMTLPLSSSLVSGQVVMHSLGSHICTVNNTQNPWRSRIPIFINNILALSEEFEVENCGKRVVELLYEYLYELEEIFEFLCPDEELLNIVKELFDVFDKYKHSRCNDNINIDNYHQFEYLAKKIYEINNKRMKKNKDDSNNKNNIIINYPKLSELMPIVDQLRKLHSLRFVHRDISLQNILIKDFKSEEKKRICFLIDYDSIAKHDELNSYFGTPEFSSDYTLCLASKETSLINSFFINDLESFLKIIIFLHLSDEKKKEIYFSSSKNERIPKCWEFWKNYLTYKKTLYGNFFFFLFHPMLLSYRVFGMEESSEKLKRTKNSVNQFIDRKEISEEIVKYVSNVLKTNERDNIENTFTILDELFYFVTNIYKFNTIQKIILLKNCNHWIIKDVFPKVKLLFTFDKVYNEEEINSLNIDLNLYAPEEDGSEYSYLKGFLIIMELFINKKTILRGYFTHLLRKEVLEEKDKKDVKEKNSKLETEMKEKLELLKRIKESKIYISYLNQSNINDILKDSRPFFFCQKSLNKNQSFVWALLRCLWSLLPYLNITDNIKEKDLRSNPNKINENKDSLDDTLENKLITLLKNMDNEEFEKNSFNSFINSLTCFIREEEIMFNEDKKRCDEMLKYLGNLKEKLKDISYFKHNLEALEIKQSETFINLLDGNEHLSVELLKYILDRFHDSYKWKCNNNDEKLFMFFQYKYRFVKKYECTHEDFGYEILYILNLYCSGKEAQLADLLSKCESLKRVTFSKGYCNYCKRITNCTSFSKTAEIPKILCINLCRTVDNDKSSCKISFPFEGLDFSKIYSVNLEENEKYCKHIYDLIGIVLECSGIQGEKHSAAYVFSQKERKWILYSLCPEFYRNFDLETDASLLFYKRRDLPFGFPLDDVGDSEDSKE